MGVDWKNSENIDKIVAALLAAHPGFSPDYSAMSVYFGQGATYDTMQGRFRTYRRMADEMKAATPQNTAASTPSRPKKGSALSTPRSSKVGVTKSKTPRKHQMPRSVPNTPTKKGKGSNATFIPEMVVLDDEDNGREVITVKDEEKPVRSKALFDEAPPFKGELSIAPIELDFGMGKDYQRVMDMGSHTYVEANENAAHYDPQTMEAATEEYDAFYESYSGDYFMA